MSQKNKNTDWKNKLPDHMPDQTVWDKIEKQLNSEVYMSEQLKRLPDYQPDDMVWRRISAGLPKNKTIIYRFKYISIAAAITIILVLSSIMYQQLRTDYPHEAYAINNRQNENEMEKKAIAELRSYCTKQMPVCEQRNFKELMQLYDELEAEEAGLKNAMQQLGDSPEMIQSMVKIENLKSETIQELILLVQS